MCCRYSHLCYHIDDKCHCNDKVPTHFHVCGGGFSISENTSGSYRSLTSTDMLNNTINSCLNSYLSPALICNTFDESIRESVHNASIPGDLCVARAGSSLSEKPTHSCYV